MDSSTPRRPRAPTITVDTAAVDSNEPGKTNTVETSTGRFNLSISARRHKYSCSADG
ncbi:putative calcium P-type ATPase NCA-3 [Fusarium fujikuroi]|nr:putative calcium P-type ATPase NCA-3 [Fusarium fujikuroi]